MWGLIIVLIILIVAVLAVRTAWSKIRPALCKLPLIGKSLCPPPSKNSKCGSSQQGGSSNTKACCEKSNKDCTGACSANTDPDACWLTCMTQRGCGGDNLPCPADYVVDVGSGEKCGDESAGGSSCSGSCCKTQYAYCDDSCKANTDPGACRVTCLKQRGCSATGACPTYYAPNMAAHEKCGDDTTGGSGCKDACCKVQESYCESNCAANTDPGACRVTCLTQRGCPTTGGSCPSSYSPNMAAHEKCGDDTTGGSGCKDACCKVQVPYCLSNCAANTNPTQCVYDCNTQRGCADLIPCGSFDYHINTSANEKCDTTITGGSRCKQRCCSQQEAYCKGACSLNTDPVACNKKCLAQRGC